jgi:uncharacterized membrane protein YesL
LGIFSRNFDKPGPGVEKDAPRKKGLARFWEVLTRDLGNLIKLNLLYQVCVLPAQALFVTFLLLGPGGLGPFLLPAVLLFFAAGALVGPATVAGSFCITKMLRDDPGFLWYDYKKIFKENLKSAAIPGIIYATILSVQVYGVFLAAFPGKAPSLSNVALLLLLALLCAMVAPYYFLQAAYLDMGPVALAKNSILLAFGHLPRSFAGALLKLLFWGFFLNYAFLAVAPVVILGYCLPALLVLMWVWPPVNQIFAIEETLVKRQAESWKS